MGASESRKVGSGILTNQEVKGANFTMISSSEHEQFKYALTKLKNEGIMLINE
jgi:hypothetical protein